MKKGEMKKGKALRTEEGKALRIEEGKELGSEECNVL
jgi:hypothetical protein